MSSTALLLHPHETYQAAVPFLPLNDNCNLNRGVSAFYSKRLLVEIIGE
jgi:hypothetical protein